MLNKIIQGDALEVLRGMPSDYFDSCVTDPPYGLGFMGKDWDKSGIANNVDLWREVLRVLKPGAHLLSFGGSRTYHRMACAIEDAGFEIRDQIMWIYGSGFPKSYDISKGIDKYDATEARRNRDLRFTKWMRSTGLTASEINEITNSFMGSHYLTDKEQPAVPTADMFDKLRPHIGNVPQWVERAVEERTIESENFKRREVVGLSAQPRGKNVNVGYGSNAGYDVITAPATPAAQLWHGWGTALKPAHEPICVARKPFKGTVAENVLQHGTGAINVDGCRIETQQSRPLIISKNGDSKACFGQGLNNSWQDPAGTILGRFPANVIHDGSEEVVRLFPESAGQIADVPIDSRKTKDVYGAYDHNSGMLARGDNGSAARFFYCAKASRQERGPGNNHPTVKPLALIQYLVKLVTPPGGIIIDPFIGSGTLGIAAGKLGMKWVGIEKIKHHIEIANRRIEREVGLLLDCGDTFGGPLDRNGVEVEEAGKGHAFDEMWGIKGRE